MLDIYKAISDRLSKKKTTNFSKFSDLPPELRLKIWQFALPERVLEASLHYDSGKWMFSHTSTPEHAEIAGHRFLPELSKVNIETREMCLREYVKFGLAYIHPICDFLYISWYWSPANNTSNNVETKFYPIEDEILAGFQEVAMTISRNPSFNTRFGALVDCLRQLGIPKKLLLSLVGPRLPSVHTLSKGFSMSNGNSVALLNWPATPDSKISEEVQAQVLTAIKTERPKINIPEVCSKMYYIYSGP